MTKILERPGVVICGASGAEFRHDGTAEGRNAAAKKASEHQRQYLAQYGVTDIRRLPKVEHVEDRSPDEIRRQRFHDGYQGQPPRSTEPVNPFEDAFARKVERLGHGWEQSPAGREEHAKLKKRSKEWEAEQQAKADAAAFQSSIVDLVGHAERSLQAVRADASATVADVEAAEKRLQIAKQGNRDEYAVLDRQYRDKVTTRIAERAAAVESQRQSLASERDRILAEALDQPEPVPVPQVATGADIPIDRSMGAVTRRIKTDNGYREVVEFVKVDAQ